MLYTRQPAAGHPHTYCNWQHSAAGQIKMLGGLDFFSFVKVNVLEKGNLHHLRKTCIASLIQDFLVCNVALILAK